MPPSRNAGMVGAHIYYGWNFMWVQGTQTRVLGLVESHTPSRLQPPQNFHLKFMFYLHLFAFQSSMYSGYAKPMQSANTPKVISKVYKPIYHCLLNHKQNQIFIRPYERQMRKSFRGYGLNTCSIIVACSFLYLVNKLWLEA